MSKNIGKRNASRAAAHFDAIFQLLLAHGRRGALLTKELSAMRMRMRRFWQNRQAARQPMRGSRGRWCSGEQLTHR